MQVPGVHQEMSTQPFNASVSEGRGNQYALTESDPGGDTALSLGKQIDLLCSKVRCCSCQNPPEDVTPGDLPSSLA